jgi:hypothetical protein
MPSLCGMPRSKRTISGLNVSEHAIRGRHSKNVSQARVVARDGKRKPRGKLAEESTIDPGKTFTRRVAGAVGNEQAFLMILFAFILGVVPLVLAEGAGAEMERSAPRFSAEGSG